MYLTIVDVTQRIQFCLENNVPLKLTQDEYDGIEAAGLLHEDKGFADVEVTVD